MYSIFPDFPCRVYFMKLGREIFEIQNRRRYICLYTNIIHVISIFFSTLISFHLFSLFDIPYLSYIFCINHRVCFTRLLREDQQSLRKLPSIGKRWIPAAFAADATSSPTAHSSWLLPMCWSLAKIQAPILAARDCSTHPVKPVCPRRDTHRQTDTFTYVISHNSWFRLKINRACRHSKTVDYANGFVLQKSVMRKKNHDRKFFYLKFWKRREDLEISFNQRFIRIYISF